MARHVLVTGGSGFLGAALSQALVARGDEVTIFDMRAPPRVLSGRADFIRGDIRRTSELERTFRKPFDLVLHLAAQTSVSASWRNAFETSAVNTQGTLNLLRCVKRLPGRRRFIFASSAAVYGEPGRVPVRESDACIPISPYGVSKLAAEYYVRLQSGAELETVVLRYFNLYGPGKRHGEDGVVAKFVQRALRCQTLTIFGDGHQSRDFLHVDDAVRGTVSAAALPKLAGRVFNIGTGHGTSVLALARLVRETLGCHVDLEFRPPRQGDIRHSRGDITLARSRLRWHPKIGLREGILTLARAR